MHDPVALLERLKARRVAVDLRSPNGTPHKAVTVVGRCHSALRAARVPAEEIQAFMDLTTARARVAAGKGPEYETLVVDIMNEPGGEMLRIAKTYLAVQVNW